MKVTAIGLRFAKTPQFRPHLVSGTMYKMFKNCAILWLKRQDLYNGSDYDWNSFPWMEETSSWPQDYSSWPQQAPTQASLQQGPQAIQSSQIQAPAVEAPYPVPSQVPTRLVGQFNTPRAWPHGRYTGIAFPTAKSQTWRDPVKSGQNAR